MKVVVIVLVAVLIVFAVALGVAARDDDGSATDLTDSFGFLEDLLPPRRLNGDDARAGGATCTQGDNLVVAPNGTCVFIVPDEVQQIQVRRTPGSGRMLIELVPPGGGLEQSIDTADNGPDEDDPNRYRLGVVDDASRVTARCVGPQACRVALEE